MEAPRNIWGCSCQIGNRIKSPWVKNLIRWIFQMFYRKIVYLFSLYKQKTTYCINRYIPTLSINMKSNLNAKKYLSNPEFFLYLFYCFAMSLSFVLCSHTAHNIFIGIESYNRNNRFMVKKCIWRIAVKHRNQSIHNGLFFTN